MATPDVVWKGGKFGQTSRRDPWWVSPSAVLLGLSAFLVYSTWAAWQGSHYTFGPYISPVSYTHLDTEAIKAAVEKTIATFGRLDVLVNNAGVAIPKPFEETTLEEMDRMININFRGLLVATQAALRHLKDGGRIINVGSCVGERNMTPGLVA